VNAVSILLFSIVRFDSLIYNLSGALALMPVVAGISYENHSPVGQEGNGHIFKLITKPGVMAGRT